MQRHMQGCGVHDRARCCIVVPKTARLRGIHLLRWKQGLQFSSPLISTKLEAMRSATRALLRLLFMATLKAMPWHMMTVPCIRMTAKATSVSEMRCRSCRLLHHIRVT